ncbi:hypothetical protein [uncultured Mesotoga sp.]|uniref:hypothetical protein n=1 Tax=uncultured Mesotoga sp. TaxID=1184400 RepID=UPI0025981FF7|nr:hypothetical protein [uncultured Mesotoga sp.]
MLLIHARKRLRLCYVFTENTVWNPIEVLATAEGAETMRLVSLKDPEQLNSVVEYRVWGSNRNLFGNCSIGEQVIFLTKGDLMISGMISGDPFLSNEVIWEKDLYQWRLPMNNLIRAKGNPVLLAEKEIRKMLRTIYGKSYGNIFHLFIQLSSEASSSIERVLTELKWVTL